MSKTKEQLLEGLKRDSFNGQITITDFENRVKKYAEMYHNEQLGIENLCKCECEFPIIRTGVTEYCSICELEVK